MPVVYETGAGAFSGAVSTLDTAVFTIGSQTDRVLVVGVVFNTASETLNTVVYDPAGVNESLTAFDSQFAAGNLKLRFWYRINPTAGASKIVRATWSGTAIGEQAVGAALFSGAHQTTPLTNQTTNSGNSANPNLAAIGAAVDDDYLMDGVIAETEVSEDAGQTFVFKNGGLAFSVQDGSVAGDIMSWTTGPPGNWAQLGVRIAAAAAGGGGLALPWQPRHTNLQGPTGATMLPGGMTPPSKV
ncbi:MAG TPA: hypothetical protein VK467_06955 [Gemmatimonadales bacterium]|nr:hypothetical protein [Gemmatimonadales bacterium]